MPVSDDQGRIRAGDLISVADQRAFRENRAAQDKSAREAAERSSRFEQLRGEREKDITSGLKRAGEIIPEGRLGRLGGFEAPEIQAARETRLRNLQRQQALQQRGLQGFQAQAGVQGGLAGQQLVNLQGQQQQAQQEAEQSLFLQQEQQQRALDQFNLEQLRRELLGQQAIAFGEAGLGAAERGAVLSQLAAESGAEATRKAGGGGKK